jgi:hypothetical protein
MPRTRWLSRIFGRVGEPVPLHAPLLPERAFELEISDVVWKVVDSRSRMIGYRTEGYDDLSDDQFSWREPDRALFAKKCHQIFTLSSRPSDDISDVVAAILNCLPLTKWLRLGGHHPPIRSALGYWAGSARYRERVQGPWRQR